MTTLTELIILHYTKTGDSAAVIHTLSREFGRRSFYVRGAGKKSYMTLFQPMNILECEVTENRKSSLAAAGKPVLQYPLLGIRNSFYKNTMTMFMSEVLFRTVREGADEPGLYDWCRNSILLLDAMESDYSNFHIWFLLEFAVKLGFMPSAEPLAPFAGEYAQLAECFLEEPFSQAMLIPMNGKTRSGLAEAILEYIGYHTESVVNVKSVKVLHEILGQTVGYTDVKK